MVITTRNGLTKVPDSNTPETALGYRKVIYVKETLWAKPLPCVMPGA